jgi:hypothetical protein
MTEAEWLACYNPDRLIQALDGKWSERKWRLTAFGFCRVVWHLVPETFQRLVQVAERHVEGLANETELSEAREASRNALSEPGLHWRQRRPEAAKWISWRGAAQPWRPTNNFHIHPLTSTDRRLLAGVLHELFDLVFRSPAIFLNWLTWKNGTIPRIAQAIYDDRRFGDMPVLADALEEAGCTDAIILDHCRRAGTHVRGCWVVDLLLGKS